MARAGTMSLRESSKPSDAEDVELVVRTQNGEREAFSELVRRYHLRIHNTIYGLVGERDDADDLSQEAFLKAYRSLPSFRGRSQFFTWIYRIAVNCALDWMKAQGRRRDVPLEADLPAPVESLDGVFRQPEAPDVRVRRRELQNALEQALAALAPVYRSALVLRELDGLTYEEIAQILGCSVGTVKSRLFRARVQMQDLLREEYREW